MSAFDRLISQIDGFIRKFYKNQLVKGLLLFVAVLIASYLFVITLEYFGRFNSFVRAILLFGFIGINGYILGKYIAIPMLRLKAFGKRIDRYQASEIIGRFFPGISDRLLNTLQLSDQMDENSADYELLNASVQQRSSAMSVVPFADAIDIGENKIYLVWVVPIVLVLISIGVLSPAFLTQGTKRVVNFTEVYEVPAPFTFELVKGEDSVEEGQDYLFEVELSGVSLPEKVYVNTISGKFLLTGVAKNKFQGKLAQVREDQRFSFEANGYKSDEYSIDVIGKTAIGKLEATIVYPDYLGLNEELVVNAGDLTIPEGASVKWSVLTKNSGRTEFWLGNSKKEFKTDGFVVEKSFKESTEGLIVLDNKESDKVDSTFFDISVVQDEFPGIQVKEVVDSVKNGIRYFSGLVNDDHGLTGLNFVYEIETKEGDKRKEVLPVSNVFGTESPFDFAVDFKRENISLEDRITYYFVVRDNDGVNGSKSTKSRSFEYSLPTLEELNEARDEDQENSKDRLKDALEKAEKFKEDFDRLRKEAMNSKQSDWNKENQVNQLKEEHKSLLEDLQNLQEDMSNSLEEKNQLSEMDEDLLEQQEMINELLEELMDDEMKELLDELEKLMQQQDKNALEENLDKLEMSSEDMKRQLERTLKMLERTRVNEKIDDLEEELKELANEQDELREETKDSKDVSDEQKERQDDINNKFEELKKDLNELDSLNQELDSPMELGMDVNKEKEEDIEKDLNDSKEQLNKDKGKKAGESQKGASDKMKEMAENLDAMQAQANQQQQEEDIDMLREILESLVALSFDQEDVMKNFKTVRSEDPAYRKYGHRQRRVINDTRVVDDSLKALAERQPKIAQFIDEELNTIHKNHELILEDIDEHERGKMLVHQQYVMTSYNNLALMLNESLQQMQQQMNSMMQGSGSCNKPGGKGKPKPGSGNSPGDMKEMLKKQLEQMKKGANPGGNKPGDKPGGGKSGGQGSLGLGNKEVAKMAAQQSAMRRRLEEMRNKLNKDGKGTGNKLNPLIKELEDQERDLVNRRLGNNLVERQKRILTRLLESEKALMERGLDEKRESKEGKNENNGNQIRFDEYNKEKLKQIELLRSVDPSYNKYYKDRANEYFNRAL